MRTKENMGLRWGFEVQHYRQASYEELERLLAAPQAPRGYRLAQGHLYVPSRRLIEGKNGVMDDAQEELLKIWRYISGSARQIKTLAVGSGFTRSSPHGQ